MLAGVGEAALALAALIGLTTYYLLPRTREALRNTFISIANWVTAPKQANTLR